MTALEAYFVGVGSGVVFTAILLGLIVYYRDKTAKIAAAAEVATATAKIEAEVKETQSAPIQSVLDDLNRALERDERKP